MGFGEAIATGFRKYFTISGRASRSEYWWFYLFVILAGFVSALPDTMLLGVPFAEGGGPVQTLVGLATFLPMITATVRRLHDTGRPGYYILVPFVFIIIGTAVFYAAPLSVPAIAVGAMIMLFGLFVQLYWLIQKSDPEANRYGPNPLTGQRLDRVFE